MSKKHKDEVLTKRAYNATFSTSEEENARGVIIGTPIVFNQSTRINDYYGEFNETIERTALDEADLRDVRLFVNHDTNKIALARSKNGNENSTMSFTIDDEGLHMRAVLDIDNNAEARALYSAVKRGDMDAMSFMFRVGEDSWTDIEKGVPTRSIKKISIVHEVSVVNFPAYNQTSVSARSAEEAADSPLKEIREKRRQMIEAEKLKYNYYLEGIR